VREARLDTPREIVGGEKGSDLFSSSLRSDPANRPGCQTMPECRFNKSKAPSLNLFCFSLVLNAPHNLAFFPLWMGFIRKPRASIIFNHSGPCAGGDDTDTEITQFYNGTPGFSDGDEFDVGRPRGCAGALENQRRPWLRVETHTLPALLASTTRRLAHRRRHTCHLRWPCPFS
jgi:hypothetical protein